MPSNPSPSATSSVIPSPSRTSSPRLTGVLCASVVSSSSPSFLVSGKTFTKQFAALYFIRLHALRPACHAAAEREGLADRVCERLLDVRPAVQCVLTGTLYKEQKLKPSILSEYSAQKKGQLPATQRASSSSSSTHTSQQYEEGAADTAGPLAELATSRGQWVSADDQCVLEDESGRITLVASDPSLISRLCTGVVVGALGVQDDSGRFHISRLLLPDMPPQATISSAPASTAQRSPRYVLLVSGLSFGCPTVDPLPLTLLVDWCCGAGGQRSDVQRAANLAAVVVMGNSLHRFAKKKSKDGLKEEFDLSDLFRPCRELDVFLTRLASHLPAVYVMAGPSDPANFTLPQQPIHSCITPSAAAYSTFTSCTNPAQLVVHTEERHRQAGSGSPIELICSAGQNVTDALNSVSGQSSVDIMSNLLRWRHLCPSAPDTLPCYPYQTADPFILTSTPHVMAVGNQPRYENRLVRGKDGQRCRLLALPSFAHTGCAALVDIHSPTLAVTAMQFHTLTKQE